MKLQGATFIITGGASGLGEGTAQVFVESGANVIIADLNPENGERAAAALGAQAQFALCDVASPDGERRAGPCRRLAWRGELRGCRRRHAGLWETRSTSAGPFSEGH